MHDQLQTLLKSGWTFELGMNAADGGLIRAVATKKTGDAIHVGKGRAVWPIEALAQAAVEAQIIEDTLKL